MGEILVGRIPTRNTSCWCPWNGLRENATFRPAEMVLQREEQAKRCPNKSLDLRVGKVGDISVMW